MEPASITRPLATVAAVLAFGVGAVGCGGNDSSSGSAASSEPTATTASTASQTTTSASSSSGGLSLAADPSGAIKYDKTALSAKAGSQTLKFTNASSTPHAVEVEGKGVETATKTITGGSAQLKLKLKPGKYEFYCPVDDHKAEGMKGVLTVK